MFHQPGDGDDISVALCSLPRRVEFSSSRGIDIDQDGIVYVSDYYNYRVHNLTPEGKF